MTFESCANVASKCESCGEAARRSNGGALWTEDCPPPAGLKGPGLLSDDLVDGVLVQSCWM